MHISKGHSNHFFQLKSKKNSFWNKKNQIEPGKPFDTNGFFIFLFFEVEGGIIKLLVFSC